MGERGRGRERDRERDRERETERERTVICERKTFASVRDVVFER